MLDEAPKRAPGVGWLLVDYRGYGASDGSPSEQALVADALAVVRPASPLSPKTSIVFGRSLGSGVAVHLAAERPVAGVILVAPFDSMVAVGKRHLSVPAGAAGCSSIASIRSRSRRKITAPLLCIVATHDEVIPAEHARRLYDAWGGPKRWVALEGAGHNSTDGASALLAEHQRVIPE